MLNKYIYVIKQTSENWFDILNVFIERRDYHQSKVYYYVFNRKDSVVL